MADERTTTSAEPAREEALVAAAATDPAAFGRLFDHHFPRVYGFVARRVGDRQAVEEVTAIAFTRALEALRTGGLGETSFGGFLHIVAATAILDHERRRAQTIPPALRASDFDRRTDAGSAADEAAARALAAALDRDALRRSLLQLPEGQLRVVLLKYLDGLEPDELCAVLGWSRQDLAMELHRALRALRGIGGQGAFGAA